MKNFHLCWKKFPTIFLLWYVLDSDHLRSRLNVGKENKNDSSSAFRSIKKKTFLIREFDDENINPKYKVYTKHISKALFWWEDSILLTSVCSIIEVPSIQYISQLVKKIRQNKIFQLPNNFVFNNNLVPQSK